MFWSKVLVSALLVAGVSKVAQRNIWWGGFLASLPLVYILSILNGRSIVPVIALFRSIFWRVLTLRVFIYYG